MKILFAVVTIALVALVPTVGINRQSQEKEPLILVQETAPLKIKLSPNGKYVRVENRSELAVKSYRLGCAVNDHGKVKARCVFDVRKVDLQPLDTNTNSLYGESFGVELSGLGHCNQKSTMLTVVEVSFSDDTVWKASEPLGSCCSLESP